MGVKGRAERGCGLLFQRGGVGMLTRSVWAKWGPWRGSGWSRRTVGRVRGFLEVSWSARNRG
jgi:hypothetical protein